MHAAGIELDDAFFIRQSTQPNTVFEGIVLRAFDHAQSRVERVAAGSQKLECVVEIGKPNVRADDNRPLGSTHRLSVSRDIRLVLLAFLLILRVQPRNQRSGSSRTQKPTTRDGHFHPETKTAISIA